jgi:hypothetical protein
MATPAAEELTNAQIERQDFVDNQIYNLVNELVPEEYRSKLPVEVTDTGFGGKGVAWDIEWITALRERIQSIIFDSLNVPESERDAFEMAFYPYLILEDEVTEGCGSEREQPIEEAGERTVMISSTVTASSSLEAAQLFVNCIRGKGAYNLEVTDENAAGDREDRTEHFYTERGHVRPA